MFHIYNGILSAIMKNEIMPFTMDRPRDCHTECKSDRKTNILWYHLYVEPKK